MFNLLFLVILLGLHIAITGLSIIFGIDLFALMLNGKYLLDVEVPTVELLKTSLSIVYADPFTACKVLEKTLIQCYRDILNWLYHYYCPDVSSLQDKHFTIPSQIRDDYGHIHDMPESEYQPGGYYHDKAVIDRELRKIQSNRIIGTLLVIYWIGCVLNGKM